MDEIKGHIRLSHLCFLKFFMVTCLRTQPDLLQYLVGEWDPNEGKFNIRGQELEIEAADIYFLTRLSRRGERPYMTGTRITGETMDMFMGRLCPGAEKSDKGGKLKIATIRDLSLEVLLSTITSAASSQAPHEATKTQLRLAVDCLDPTIFN